MNFVRIATVTHHAYVSICGFFKLCDQRLSANNNYLKITYCKVFWKLFLETDHIVLWIWNVYLYKVAHISRVYWIFNCRASVCYSDCLHFSIIRVFCLIHSRSDVSNVSLDVGCVVLRSECIWSLRNIELSAVSTYYKTNSNWIFKSVVWEKTVQT